MENLVQKIEGIAGGKVPDDILEFYRGEFDDVITPAEITVPYKFEWIDYIDHLVEAEDALWYLENDVNLLKTNDRRVSSFTIPIACSEDDELFVYSLRQHDYGTIYYLFHECVDPMDDSMKGAIPVAESFSEWVTSFRKSPKREPTADWDAIHATRIQEILNRPSLPWWKFWGGR